MIGQLIVDKDGNPIDSQGQKLSPSPYQPSTEVKQLWERVQRDYQVAFSLQHRAFKEFDGYSLLQRAKLDQELFAAYVGCEYQPVHKRWRWKGRKNTARNKLIGILAHMLTGMLYPFVNAKNTENEEDKMTARVMRILVEDHLKKAKYELKFLYIILSALVNPATYVEVEWVEAIQKIKQQLANGQVRIIEAVDDILSGLNINIIPIDEVLPMDYYSGIGNLQILPGLLRVRRIPWDYARARYAGKFFDEYGKDLFDYVQAGQTRVLAGTSEGQVLFDTEWTEADGNFVQEITAYYRSEDIQVRFVGGVFLGNTKNVYNTNPFEHRRLTLLNGEWISVPILNIAMSGFEPIDPSGRFLFFKSAAFKEYWDDQALNKMHQLALDGTYLDVIKPMFLSGVTKVDSTVMVPGATVGMPLGASATPYQLGPNLKAAYDAIRMQQEDMSESTQDKIMNGAADPNVTATQTNQAVQQAKILLGAFGYVISDLIRQVGELTMDCIINHATLGEIDTTVPGSLGMKYKTFLSKGKEKGRSVTHRIEFTTKSMGKKFTHEQIKDREWRLYNKTGRTPLERYNSDQRLYEVNPYQFARTSFTMGVDVDQMIDKSIGATRARKTAAVNMLASVAIAPFTDQQAVADEVIREFGQDLADDPDKFKKKEAVDPNQMLNTIMGGGKAAVPGQEKNPTPGVPAV